MDRTQLSEDSPEVNSENLLVLLVPLIFVFGVSLFFSLLDQMNLLFRGMRYLVVGVFAVIICLPMEFTFFCPKHCRWRIHLITRPPSSRCQAG